MKPGQAIGAGITASAIAHLSIVALLLFFAEVHPFGSVTAEPIAVDIVSPAQVAEIAKEPEPDPILKPQPSFDLPSTPADPSSKPAASAAPAQAAAPEPAAPPQQQAPPPAQRPNQQQAAAQAQPPLQSQPQPQVQPPPPQQQSQPAAAIPAAIPQAPDISIKYHMMLGLPQTATTDGFDAPALAKADVASSLVAEFRRHLRSCSKLPGSIAPSDNVRIVMRIFMTAEGKLSTEPVLIEASASAKGPLLMQSAISALQACQPYTMLPANRYGEWKMLDLSFTPQDFSGG